jgi:hypothetical protein
LYHLLSGLEEDEPQYPFESLVGMHTIRYHLANVEHYCIPPGAAADLLTQQRRLTGRLSDGARTFLRTIEEAGRSQDPIGMIRARSGKSDTIPQILRENLLSIASGVEEKLVLDSALEKCVTILDFDLMQNRLPPGRVFSRTVRFLNGVRQRTGATSDVNDGINMEMVAQLCANGAHYRGVGILPCLFTHTDPLVNLGMDVMRHLGVPQDAPHLVSRYPYLIVSQGLRLRTENRHELAAQEARLLGTEVAGLDQAIQRVLSCLKQLPEHEQELAHIPSEDWDLLLLKTQSLLSSWPEIFGPAKDLLSKDRVNYLNGLMSDDICQKLSSGSAETVRMGVAQLAQRIRTARSPVYELQRLAGNANAAIAIESGYRPLLASSTICAIQNSGPALEDLKVGQCTPSNVCVDSLRAVHDIRFIAHCPTVSSGALIALDSWREEADRHGRACAFIWPHEEDAEALILAGVALVHIFTAVGEQEFMRYRVVDQEEVLEAQTKYKDASLFLRSLFRSRCRMAEYFELTSNIVTFFGEVQTAGSSEKQLGLKFHRASLRGAPLHALAQSVSETSIYPLDSEFYRELLSRLSAKAYLFVEL